VSLQGFFDDSGSGIPVLTLCGYISPYYWWEDFSERWQKLLDEEPRLPYFKMRDAAKLQEHWGKMDVSSRNDRLAKFFALIKEAVHGSVSVVIPIAKYKRIVKGNIRKEWDDPYFWAIFDIVHGVVVNQVQNSQNTEHDRVEFIFDDNPRLAAQVPKWYQVTRQVLPPYAVALMAASPRFENDEHYLPLQAGDALAWYYRRCFAERLQGESWRRDLPKELFSPLDTISAMISFWGEQRMNELVQNRPKNYASMTDDEVIADLAQSRAKINENIQARYERPHFRDIHHLIAEADLS
jgi:hypothetical protein